MAGRSLSMAQSGLCLVFITSMGSLGSRAPAASAERELQAGSPVFMAGTWHAPPGLAPSLPFCPHHLSAWAPVLHPGVLLLVVMLKPAVTGPSHTADCSGLDSQHESKCPVPLRWLSSTKPALQRNPGSGSHRLLPLPETQPTPSLCLILQPAASPMQFLCGITPASASASVTLRMATLHL